MELHVIFIIISFSLYFTYKFLRKGGGKPSSRLPLPPGPKPWPLIGCVPEMLKNKPVFRWIHRFMDEMNTDISLLRLGNTNVITVCCPNMTCEVLKSKDAIFCTRPMSYATDVYCQGVLTAIFGNGNRWKMMRKVIISETLCPQRHNWLYQKREKEADNLVFFLHNQYKKNKPVNIRMLAQHFNGNVIRRSMFGRRFFGKGMPDGGPGAEEIEHLEAIFTALKHLFSFCVSDYLPFLAGLNFDGQEKVARESGRIIRKYQDPIIDERVKQWRSGERTQMEDWIDVWITLRDANGKPLIAPEEIKSQAVELSIAALDNPSNVVEWTMAELMNQPELLRKATEELDRVVGKDRLLLESDIPQLNYVKACVRETFRLHPIADFFVPHVSTEDSEVGGYFIPKGSHVYISRVGVGRNPKAWTDPLKFDPERHLKDGVEQVVLTENEGKLISFGMGRRGCPANMIGTFMTAMLLGRMLHGFSWTPAEYPPAKVDLSESPHDLSLIRPLSLHVEPRLPAHLYDVEVK